MNFRFIVWPQETCSKMPFPLTWTDSIVSDNSPQSCWKIKSLHSVTKTISNSLQEHSEAVCGTSQSQLVPGLMMMMIGVLFVLRTLDRVSHLSESVQKSMWTESINSKTNPVMDKASLKGYTLNHSRRMDWSEAEDFTAAAPSID